MPSWAFFAVMSWVAAVVGFSIFRRRIGGKPIFPMVPQDARFSERFASGSNMKNFITRIGGAQNCLMIVVTAEELRVCPIFPFNLMFLPDIYGLEFTVPRDRIESIERRKIGFGETLTVRWSDGGFRFRSRKIDALQRALAAI